MRRPRRNSMTLRIRPCWRKSPRQFSIVSRCARAQVTRCESLRATAKAGIALICGAHSKAPARSAAKRRRGGECRIGRKATRDANRTIARASGYRACRWCLQTFYLFGGVSVEVERLVEFRSRLHPANKARHSSTYAYPLQPLNRQTRRHLTNVYQPGINLKAFQFPVDISIEPPFSLKTATTQRQIGHRNSHYAHDIVVEYRPSSDGNAIIVRGVALLR